MVQPEEALNDDAVAKKCFHGPADVLQAVTAILFRPRGQDHLLHYEEHEDLHVRRVLVIRFVGVGNPDHNLVCAEIHYENAKSKSRMRGKCRSL